MWMRLLAGATAHEINNLAHGLGNLHNLPGQRDNGDGASARLATGVDGHVEALEALARDLRALASAGARGAAPAHGLELIFADAAVEAEATEDRRVVLQQSPPEARAAGSADALRVAVRALLRYALAATPAGGEVRLGATLEPGFAIATIDAPAAPPPASADLVSLQAAPSMLDAHSTFDVVLAGAIAAELGGELRLGATVEGGLRFALALPRAS